MPKRYRVPLIVAGAGAAVLVVGGTWLWIDRTPIATRYIDDMLAARHVPARYHIASLGFRTERIENIRLGDPANPDLTADSAEVWLSVGFGGVRVRAVDAAGVRLRGRLIGGRLSLGAIDRLLPTTPSGQAPSLPDIALRTRDAHVTLETPQGIVRATVTGSGGLADGFQGKLLLASDRLSIGGCAVTAPQAALAVAVTDRRPSLKGPARAAAIDCPRRNAHIAAPRLDIEARSETDLARWRGTVVVQRAALSGGGAEAANVGGRVDFDASSRMIRGGGSLFADRVRTAAASSTRLVFDGDYRIDPRGKASVIGTLGVKGGALAPGQVERWLPANDGLSGTPFAPIAAAWRSALARAGQAIQAQADLSLAIGDGGMLRIERLDASSVSGARLLIRGERVDGLAIRWPGADPILNGSAELGGGGLPELRASLRQTTAGAPLSGSISMLPYRAGAAQLALDPVHFGRSASGGMAIETKIIADGPLADGRIEGLSLPISMIVARDGAIFVNRRCARLAFDRLAIAGTTIARTELPLCPRGGVVFGRSAAGGIFGGATIAAPRLQGHVGTSPLSLSARSIDVAMAKPGFVIPGLAIRLGDAAAPTRFDAERLDGRVDPAGIAGHIAGASGNIGAVPLLLSKGEGNWRLASGILTLRAALRVADAEQATPRFRPLRSDDVALKLENKRITVTATVKEPASGRAVSGVTIRHDLTSGRGDATLDVRNLTFDKILQPEQLTPLTQGIIANVKGAITGEGHIGWAGGVVTSDGQFHTDGTDLAAAFGPVNGIRGTIRFTDLLGLVSAPEQEVRIAELNPGVAVTNGVIHYQLLPDRHVAITAGTWPFSGGTLALEPTILDFGRPVARRMTFRLTGLDAATFLQQLEFKNIAVTGKFDGTLPIVFEGGSGRIENGLLTVRRGGGTLAYVGDVTNADLGRFARLAFDALKSMHYDRLTLELNGALDGEIVSKVRFDGTNDAPVASASRHGLAGRMLAPLTGLPFRFNITITAPFRGLVNSAQTFADPSILLKQAQPEPPAAPAPIQPR